jgi:hypothetical protein
MSGTINKQFAPKFVPPKQRFEMCSLTLNETSKKKGFCVGLICSSIEETCNLSPPVGLDVTEEERNGWTLHPQRLIICQNWTFWSDRRRKSRHGLLGVLYYIINYVLRIMIIV